MKKQVLIIISVVVIICSFVAGAVGGIVTNLFYEYYRKDSKGRIRIKRSITIKKGVGRY